MTNILELTQKLISIPSWVDSQTNEIQIGEYIFDFLKENTNLLVTKEMVTDGRFNILAQNSPDINTLIVGHIDTVGISSNWETSPIDPVIKDGKLFGRGATDMKSGIAAMMLMAANNKLPANTGLLFYIDEEYDFAGMKQFIRDYCNKIKPKNIVSLDGSELEILNGCRGLIEISGTITGVACHASRPQNGVNAIEAIFKSVEKLKEYLSQYNDPELGVTSLNLASVNGGQAANVVPDTCRFVIDVRPSSSDITADLLVNELNNYAISFGAKLSESNIKFDLGSWLTHSLDLLNLGLPVKDIQSFGYADIQMLWQVFDRPKCFTIGAGSQSTAHASNEYIELEKLNKLENILIDIIQKI